ncbi:MAG: LysM peptidoglycan-binding domain-containing protein [Phycisphaerales bacterium]|nr:LysM peptidoglycan-binding domain-containing protein [Phycisphaerales bacterium]
MRTDAKIGLVGFLVVVIAVIAYFSLRSSKPHESAPSQNPTSVEVLPGGLVISPPPTGNSADSPTSLPIVPAPAYTPAPSQTQGPVIIPPSADTALTVPGSSPTTAPGDSGRVSLVSPNARARLLPPPGSPTTEPARGGTVDYGRSYPASNVPAYSGTDNSDNRHTGTGSGLSSNTDNGDIPNDIRPGDSLLDHGTPPGSGSIGNANPATYTIQNGDTFSSIAKKFNTTAKAIQEVNPKVEPTRLKIKQVINLPVAKTSTSTGTSASTNGTNSSARSTDRGTRSITTTSTTRPARTAATAGTTYTVKKGDTLRKIAKSAYGDENLWQRIFRANRSEIPSANDIKPGMTLKLPPK